MFVYTYMHIGMNLIKTQRTYALLKVYVFPLW